MCFFQQIVNSWQLLIAKLPSLTLEQRAQPEFYRGKGQTVLDHHRLVSLQTFYSVRRLFLIGSKRPYVVRTAIRNNRLYFFPFSTQELAIENRRLVFFQGHDCVLPTTPPLFSCVTIKVCNYSVFIPKIYLLLLWTQVNVRPSNRKSLADLFESTPSSAECTRKKIRIYSSIRKHKIRQIIIALLVKIY